MSVNNTSDRAQLIRQANREFNAGNIRTAARIYESTHYKDGLIRVGDHFYKKRQPLIAYGYYKKANYKPMLDSLQESFILALKFWLTEDEPIEKSKEISVENGGKKDQTSQKNQNIPQLGRDKYKKEI